VQRRRLSLDSCSNAVPQGGRWLDLLYREGENVDDLAELLRL
jgi:hypothetical protein